MNKCKNVNVNVSGGYGLHNNNKGNIRNSKVVKKSQNWLGLPFRTQIRSQIIRNQLDCVIQIRRNLFQYIVGN